jgi:uncharacterized protein YydD (DUF2326 family)
LAPYALDKYESNAAYENVQDDLSNINSEVDHLRSKQAAFRYELKKIQMLPASERIRKSDIEIIYNQFKDGLGNFIVKNLEETLQFKEKVEAFQADLMKEKAVELHEQLNEITDKIRNLERVRIQKLNATEAMGVLKDIKNAYSIYEEKIKESRDMQSKFGEYELKEHEKTILEQEKSNLFMMLSTEKNNCKETIEKFNETIVKIHEFIMGNSKASFDLQIIKESDKIIYFDMRIFDDGSHSVNREKVFIYDMALMFNQVTSQRHPRLLIHDNIFEVDQDTLIQSLNFLYEQELINTNFQYILTLNRDKIEMEEKSEKIKLDINGHLRASFTKEKRFLKKQYQEI